MVAIIALLISILLPSLNAAREQGKMAKCLSNLRSLNTATTTYLLDNRDEYPFLSRSAGPVRGICSWAYGGKTTDDFWKTRYSGVFYFKATERPINYYLVNGDITEDEPMHVLRCPSDQGSYQRVYSNSPWEQEPVTAHDDIGTSYHYNLHGFTGLSNFDFNRPIRSWRLAQAAIMRDALGSFAARYALYFEDPLDWCINEKVQVTGNHRQFSHHTIGFLDGHASYLYVDSRNWCGPGWTMLNPNWLRTPDYTPPVYYTASSGKHCN